MVYYVLCTTQYGVHKEYLSFYLPMQGEIEVIELRFCAFNGPSSICKFCSALIPTTEVVASHPGNYQWCDGMRLHNSLCKMMKQKNEKWRDREAVTESERANEREDENENAIEHNET
jgi:hypothetical protein